MRLLLLNQYYPPDAAPTGRVLHDLARTLVARGHQVHVVCSRRSYAGGETYPARELRDGVQVHRVPAQGFGRGGAAARLADYASFTALLFATVLVRIPRPDLILALTTPPYVGLAAAAVARLRGCAHAHWIMDLYPDVMAAHGMIRPDGLAWRFLGAATRRQLRHARLVLALGPFMARRLEPYLEPGRSAVWVPLWGDGPPAPWPVGEPNRLRQERGWGPDELVLMYSGNMGFGHRFGEFLAAAARLGPAGPRWAFVGGGPRRAEIDGFARAHPEARVSLLPYVPPQDLRASLCAADVHLASLSGAWQGLIVPSKIQASFSVGKPVLFVGPSDNEVAGWIEESGGGWVVGEDDIDGLLGATDQARDASERARRGASALEFARAHFDPDRNCESLARRIEAALGA